ncbi:MAG: 4a-hydroxytetrahydrobiopterin dehydratase, partial [Clostridia bacterium]
RKYRFKAFADGIQFVNRIAVLADQYDHHPLIAIDYKLVTLRLSSWNAGGLTDLDLKMAAEMNEIFTAMKNA